MGSHLRTATLVSRHSPQEIERRLLEEIKPIKWTDIFTMRNFTGSNHDDGFHLRRTGRRSSLLMNISVQPRPRNDGDTQIDVSFNQSSSSVALAWLFSLIGAVFLLIGLSSVYQDGFSPDLLVFLIPLMMAAVAYYAPILERDHSLMLLRQLLHAKSAG